jgi:signal transduction histidine kinase
MDAGSEYGQVRGTAAAFRFPHEETRLDIVTGESASADREVDALRRVATLVAQDVQPAEIFSAVSDEVDGLFGCSALVMKFDRDLPGVFVAGVSKSIDVPVGSRLEFQDGMASAEVFRTGQSARVEAMDWSTREGRHGAEGQRLGVVSAVASPIVVQGRVWGVIALSSSDRVLPLDTEERLEKFTELIESAIANAESREALERIAEEQAALRRVATLVARGAPSAEVFQAVSEEVASLFGENLAAVGRYDADGSTVTIVGFAANVEGLEVGTRVPLHAETPTGMAYATGRSARVDREDWTDAVSGLDRLYRLAVVSWVTCPVIVEGRLWGCLSLAARHPLPAETEKRLERFSELVATAIANTESRSELAASRRRIVTASDEVRRRIERDLHDGTQQRLVALGLAVRAVEADAPADLTNLHSELSRIATGLGDAAAELQEISRGIHPANLSRRGLGAALRTLARRSSIPVDLEITIEGRLPESVEVAAFYVTSEALANAAKHARASRVEVSVTSRDNAMFLSIRDDGIGGADPVRGSGLVGLVDRVQALGGTIDIQSPPGDGTYITSMLPLDGKASDDRDDLSPHAQ